ncbi:hypothetical protein AB0890_00540 [Streptomyces sp. NPDC005406]|uniref:hypothetical protein n=1 Tax=Streptomyces sp. NPDC005406 TaxID=3155339 RepID=UPI003453AD6D
MPFDPLLFCGDNEGGDQFTFVVRPERPDIFLWDHGADSRLWVGRELEGYVRRSLDGDGDGDGDCDGGGESPSLIVVSDPAPRGTRRGPAVTGERRAVKRVAEAGIGWAAEVGWSGSACSATRSALHEGELAAVTVSGAQQQRSPWPGSC